MDLKNLIHFTLVTPERTVLSEELDSLSCPTELGQITILPNHVALVANLVSGELVAKNEGKEHFINVTGGFVEIRPHNEVIVLADAAEHHYEIDEQRALEAKKRAETEIREKKLSGAEYAKVSAVLERNLTRVNIARKHSHRRSPMTSEGIFKE
jgi:F-type H+-transporting ATPase subunit epsilon